MADSAPVPVAPTRRGPRSWSELWQAPTIVVSVGLIAAGFIYARRDDTPHDFDGALAQVETYAADGRIEHAANALDSVISPYVHEATPAQQGRFHAAAGEVLHRSMERDKAWTDADLRLVLDRFAEAERLGHVLSPAQIARQGDAHVRLGEIAKAEANLQELDRLRSRPHAPDNIAIERNRLLRSLVNAALADRSNVDRATLLLDAYRADPGVSVGDALWAIARQAELRLSAGLAREAADHLLVDMRLIEPRVGDNAVAFAELHYLLGRACYEIDDFDRAERQLQRSLDLFHEADPMRFEAHAALGNVMLAGSRFEEAFEQFDRTARHGAGSPSRAAALLGRAETQAILGRHDEAQADYVALAAMFAEAKPASPSPERIAASLIDRHDAALATIQLSLAKAYIELCDRFFERGVGPSIPAEVLVRQAATNQAIAEQLLAVALGDAEVGESEEDQIDPDVRREASGYAVRAAELYLRHADAVDADSSQGSAWLESTWHAADNFDRAGRTVQAAETFARFIANWPADDARALEARYRLARCRQALGDDAAAALAFEELISLNERSPFATRSHVPLARCYVALGRPLDAERQLHRVVSGREPLDPAANDYREALLALGSLYHDTQRFTEAVQTLDRAMNLYPEDPAADETRFLLADSYRGAAGALDARVREEPLTRSQREDLQQLRNRHLETAQTLFSRTAASYDRQDERRLDRLQREYHRMSHLYAADCAFARGELEASIELYDQAARRFAEHPSSVVALVQIVNAYTRLGDAGRAATAHNRALLRLQQLPAEALADPAAVLDQEAWRRWLEDLPPGVHAANTVRTTQVEGEN
jgi:tetratricopeptide (TPR) repeat protein